MKWVSAVDLLVPTCSHQLILILQYFIKYRAHFFTLKIMLKYYLHIILGRLPRKGLRWLLWWVNLQWLILVKLFLKFFLPKIIVKFRCALYSCALYSIKYSIFHSYKTTYLNMVNHTETSPSLRVPCTSFYSSSSNCVKKGLKWFSREWVNYLNLNLPQMFNNQKIT